MCRLSDLPAGRGWPVRIGDRRLAVFADGGRLYALDNVCLHAGSPLDDGAVWRGCVTCPWHGWRYELASGDLMTSAGHRPGVRTYPARSDGERVWVDLDYPGQ